MSSFLAIGLLPLNLLIYTTAAYEDRSDGAVEGVDFGDLSLSLGVVVSAVVIGTAVGYFYDKPKFRLSAYHTATAAGVAMLVVAFFISSQGSNAENTKVWNQSAEFYIATALPCLLGMVIANLITSFLVKLPPQERVAVCVEVCYQNVLISVSVAVNVFSDKDERARAVAVPIFYGTVMALITFVYCIFAWKMVWTKAPPDENYWVMFTTLYKDEENMSEDAPESVCQDETTKPGGAPENEEANC